MNQSTIIFGYLAVAFLIFITQRGELPVYWGFLVSSPAAPSSGPTASGNGALTYNAPTKSSSSDTGSQVVSYVANNAAMALKVFAGA